MRIIHISDVHLAKDNLYDFKSYYLEALLKDLTLYNAQKSIDLLIITGDLLDKGGQSFVETVEVFDIFEVEFIRPIIESLNLSKNNVLFIPGNHDVIQKEINNTYEIGLVSDINSLDKANAQLPSMKCAFDLTNNRLEKFKEFEKKFHATSNDYFFSNNESLFIYQENGFKIGFALINDSWRCSSSLKPENHFIGVNQILNAKNFFSEKKTDFNFILMHHPIELLNEDEQREIKNIINRWDFEIVLYGHTHKTLINQTFGVNGNAIYLNAKSAFSDPRIKIADYQPGYNVIDLDLTTLEIECKFRKYIHSRFEFDADTNVAPSGIYKTKLIPKGEKAVYYEMFELASRTIESHIDDFNNSLLIYNTKTIAPQNIEELFVLPKLTENPSAISNNDIEKKYSIDDLLLDEKNIVLFGKKESGKSTLLNRISIEMSNNFPRYKRIPVYINFKSLTKNDIPNLARKYLNITNDKVHKYASAGEFLILIDNYDETENLLLSNKNLSSFLDGFSKNKLILSTNSSFQRLSELEQSVFVKFKMKPIFIGSVGINEFKQLASKWFRNKDEEWHNTNIERLIKVFRILRIPRTFFSISLYLWIIEKQESFKPINKNYLVNKFLQFILEGLIEDEGKAGSFNFDRKKEILAEIALKMYQKGEILESYSLIEAEIIEVINIYANKNQREYNSSEICQLFFDKGIFKFIEVDNVEKIIFRFESFFQFFLSFNIDNNKKFKDKVFTKEEILSFIDEIEYYSGRHQSDTELLENTIGLLERSFEKLDSFIEDDTDQYLPKKFVILDKLTPLQMESELKSGGMDQKEQEKNFEKQMENLPVNDSIQIKQKYNYEEEFSMTLELAAKVLKNAENIQNPEMINKSLDLIIQKTSKFGVFMQSILSDEIKEGKNDNSTINLDLLILFGPLLDQTILMQWVGTDFLHIPLKRKIENYLVLDKANHKQKYDQFLSLFIYVDLKLPDYISLLRKTVKSLDHKYFAELYFFKVLYIYRNTPKGSKLIPDYKEILSSLLVKSRGVSKDVANKSVAKEVNKSNDDIDLEG